MSRITKLRVAGHTLLLLGSSGLFIKFGNLVSFSVLFMIIGFDLIMFAEDADK